RRIGASTAPSSSPTTMCPCRRSPDSKATASASFTVRMTSTSCWCRLAAAHHSIAPRSTTSSTVEPSMKKMPLVLGSALLALPAICAAAQLLVLNKSDATLAFMDPVSGKTSATVPTGDGPHEIEVSADGKLAFVTNYGAKVAGNSLTVVDTATRKE